MKHNPRRYTVSKRKDCDRWQLTITDAKPPLGFGILYGGLFKTPEEAVKAAKERWGLPQN